MPGPYAIRVKTPAGWQDLTGPPGPKGDPGILDVSLILQPRVVGSPRALYPADGWFLYQHASQFSHNISKSDGTNNDFTLDVNKYAWTALKAGTYTITASLGTPSGATVPNAGTLSARICVKNGAVPVAADYLIEDTNAADAAGRSLVCTVTFTQVLAAGDQISLFAKCDGFGSPTPITVGVLYFGMVRNGAGPPGAAGGNATVPIEAWRTVGAVGEPAFTNGWKAYNASYPVQFRKRPDGTLEMRGLLSGGSLPSAAFTLPAGYLPPSPPNERYFECFGSTNGSAVAPCGIYVTSAGVLSPHNLVGWVPATGYISVDQVRFSTDQTTFPSGPQGPPGPGIRGLVTSLPSSAQEGDECYFQTAAMKTLGLIWHFRYDATPPVGKPAWIFLGGSSWQVDVGSMAIPVGTNTAIFATTLSLPLAGDYMVEHGGRYYNSAAPAYGNMSARLQIFRASAVAINDIAIIDFWTAAAPSIAGTSITPHLSRSTRLDGVQAADVLRMAAGASGVVGVIDHAWFKATPIRVA